LAPSRLILFLLLAQAVFALESNDYVGAQVCAQCHRAIAASQTKTNMAMTWQSPASPLLPPGLNESVSEGPGSPIAYNLRQTNGKLVYQLTLPGNAAINAPVEAIVGGKRHGLSFLARVPEIGGRPLARPALVETRYLHSTHTKGLVLSPGFPVEKPSSYETAIGRVLAPDFERKCLTCHGEPSGKFGTGGVHCETCHGPGQAHLKSVADGMPKSGIVNPARLTNAELVERCSQCHGGFADLSDPLPDDLLISNQANALRNSECYVQSAAGLSCINCHDPHQDSAEVGARSVAACRSCHDRAAPKRAAVCPVNQKDACIDCHMPEVKKGSFTMSDHWIRVHPEQDVRVASKDKTLRTTLRPRRLFLRIIVTEDQVRAVEARARIQKGESFFDVAREYSIDATAPGGGYLGETALDQMEPRLAEAVANLNPGETSAAVENNGKHIVFQRLPRDFREQADRVQRQASALRAKGNQAEAIAKYRDALKIYPHFLRALIFLGTTLGEQGQPANAAGVLEFGARLYPKDPAAQYNLGIALGALGRPEDEMRAYRKAIELQPDLIPAYQNLGAVLLSAGQPANAAQAYRQGIDQNPLAAALYYNLAIVEEQIGEKAAAQRWLELARAIDPELVMKQQH
jgi:tetratricopeptide (TPR) repeat protein